MHDTAQQSDQPALLRLGGHLDIYHADDVLKQLRQHLAGADSLQLDLSAVEACDAAGVQLLLSARRSASDSATGFDLRAMSPAVASCLQQLGLPPTL